MKLFIALVVAFIAVTFSVQGTTTTKVNGAGASFPYPIYSKWFSEYEKTNSDVQFNYQAIGSSGGIRQLLKQTIDFGASDTPMNSRDQKNAKWPVQHVPTVIGAISVSYNLPTVNQLNLDGETLANIYLTKIIKWNDPAIAKLNPKLQLPNQDIVVLRRTEASGSTFIFSDFLASSSANWKSKMKVAKSQEWPTSTIAVKGNSGMTEKIKSTTGAIGYVELAYAAKNNLKMAKIKNRSGNFIAPSIDSMTAAASNISAKHENNLTQSLVSSEDKAAYPISAFTYLLLPNKKGDDKLTHIKKFLNWALTDGQVLAPQLHYAPLPQSLSSSLVKQFK